MLFILCVLSLHQLVCAQTKKVFVGADVVLSDSAHLIMHKRVAVIAHHASILSSGEHLVDALLKRKEFILAAILSPEHGYRGNAPAGAIIRNTIDSASGVRIFSLYGETKKPTDEMLRNIDVILFDLQDVGARYYTYLSTLFYAMQSAAEQRIPFIVLDRPNPITGNFVEGPLLDEALTSFVGIVPIPIRHGMTLGELARMMNGEGWLGKNLRCDLHVMRMKNWRRNMWMDETGLAWKAPSPNIKRLQSAIVYPGTCLFEGTNISEGRGTEHPFEFVGAPFLDGEALSRELNERKIPGAAFRKMDFTPQSITGVALAPKYENETCHGVSIVVTDRAVFQPVRCALEMLAAMLHQAKSQITFREHFFRLIGRNDVVDALMNGKSAAEIIQRWKHDLQTFALAREKYFLYN